MVSTPAPAAVGDAVVCLPLRALGAAELHAPAASSVRLAVGRSALRALVAPGLLAPLPAAMGNAQARCTSRTFGTPLEPALLREPALSWLPWIGCIGDSIGAHTKRSLRHGRRRRFRAQLKTTLSITSTAIGVVRAI
jgi:hypothetical protein